MDCVDHPKVSVIMAVYNSERTLRESIESIIEQTYTNWEFVICDDCSSDSSLQILYEYKKKYPSQFIILHNDKNMKLSYSLNRCLKESKGEYIARMDADDKSRDDRLVMQVAFLDEHMQYQVVGSCMQRFDTKGLYDVVRVPETPNASELKNSVPFCHATIMMRKTAYDSINGYKESNMTVRSQDVDLWFRFFANGFKGYNIQDALYFVREDINAIKRRTIKVRWNELRIRYCGFRLLQAPLYWYIFPLVRFLFSFVPRRIVLLYRNYQKGANK